MGRSSKPRKKTGSQILGKELRLRRSRRSYAEMARLAESPPLAGRVEPVSASYLHKIETGARMPSVESLRTLSLLYGLPIEHMFRLIEAEQMQRLEAGTPADVTAYDLREAAADAIRIGDYQGGFVAALRAQEVAEDAAGFFAAGHDKAICMWKLGFPREAVGEVQDLLASRNVPARHVLTAYYTLAAIHRSLANLTLAEDAARRGMEKGRGEKACEVHADLQRLLANVLSDRAEVETDRAQQLCLEAQRQYEKALSLYDDLDLQAKVGSTLLSIGVLHRIEGSTLLAFQRLREGLALCRRTSNRLGVAFGLKELGVTNLGAGEWPAARKNLLDAEAEAAAGGYIDIQFQALVHLAEGARERGEPVAPLVRRAERLLPFLESPLPERKRFEDALLAEAGGGGMP